MFLGTVCHKPWYNVLMAQYTSKLWKMFSWYNITWKPCYQIFWCSIAVHLGTNFSWYSIPLSVNFGFKFSWYKTPVSLVSFLVQYTTNLGTKFSLYNIPVNLGTKLHGYWYSIAVPLGTYTHTQKKISNRMTASVLKQDPNTKRFEQTLIYFNTDTQYAILGGNPLYQATDNRSKTMKNERKRLILFWFSFYSLFCAWKIVGMTMTCDAINIM